MENQTTEMQGKFAYELKTGRVMTKCFADEIAAEHTGPAYGEVEISFSEWTRLFKTLPVGYAPFYVNGSFEIRELDEYKSQHEITALENEMAELKRYLLDTDYVVTKINEAMIESDEEANSLREEYADVLAKRKTSRVRINEIETEIDELKNK